MLCLRKFVVRCSSFHSSCCSAAFRVHFVTFAVSVLRYSSVFVAVDAAASGTSLRLAAVITSQSWAPVSESF